MPMTPHWSPSKRPSRRASSSATGSPSRGSPPSALETYIRGRPALFTHPTNDGLRCLLVAWPLAEQREVQADLERQFMAVVDRVPELTARLREGRQVTCID